MLAILAIAAGILAKLYYPKSVPHRCTCCSSYYMTIP